MTDGTGTDDGRAAVVGGSSPATGDRQVDAVLQRMRDQLGMLAADDLTGRRSVLADADGALRALLDADADADADVNANVADATEPDPDDDAEAGAPGSRAG